jgi:hypothetical protein
MSSKRFNGIRVASDPVSIIAENGPPNSSEVEEYKRISSVGIDG